MISLTAFRQNLLPLFRVMGPTGMYVDVVYKGQLYRVHMENLRQRVPQKRQKRTAVRAEAIEAKTCDKCKGLMLNGVCMAPKCSANIDRGLITPASVAR